MCAKEEDAREVKVLMVCLGSVAFFIKDMSEIPLTSALPGSETFVVLAPSVS